MPSVPTNNKCSELGCINLRSNLNTYCMTHCGKQSTKSENKRVKSKEYNSAKWKHLRQRQLTAQPLCQSCITEGRVCQASDVDHVFAWSAIGQQAFMHNIFQSLCHNCHSHKTQLEQQGIYRHYTHQNGARDYAISEWAQVQGID